MPLSYPSEGDNYRAWMETQTDEGGAVTLVDPAAIPVTANKTYYAVCASTQVEVPVANTYTVIYDLGEHGTSWNSLSETVEENGTVASLPEVTADDGYTFLGWAEEAGSTELVNPAEVFITADKIFYAVYEEQAELPEPDEYGSHRAYASGVNRMEFHPDEAITRGDVAAMLARMMEYDSSEEYDTSSLSDVEDHWARNAIGFCVQEGLLGGYADGTFLPDNTMSRQEFAVILSRLVGVRHCEGDLPFTDAGEIKNWSKDAIYTAYTFGLMSGYTDGTFRPTRSVTRAEATKVFNVFLGYNVDRNSILNYSARWIDVSPSHWAYYDIMEASVDHDWYEINGVEFWTGEE